jgi:hypothetical protein
MKQAGLTLIEVLIASVILFMTLGLVASVFQQNIAMQSRAIGHLQVADDYNSLVAQIRFELGNDKVDGEIEHNGRRYQWLATEVSRAKEISSLDEESTGYMGNIGMLVLFNIAVTPEVGSGAFEFRQAIWQNKEV